LRKVSELEMKQPCHRWIGALTFEVSKGQVGKGSAILISSNLILTVAHNIYDRKYQTSHTKFKFYLGACGIVDKYY
jgi:V8-like Glu-specific endopeptidase